MIRPMEQRDLDKAVALYITGIEHSLYGKIGCTFVRILLSGILRSEGGISFVCEQGGVIVGFIASSTDTAVLMGEVLKRSGLQMVPTLVRALCRTPRLLFYVPQTWCYKVKTACPGIEAEMLYVVVGCSSRERGISKELVGATLEAMRARGVRGVKVTTEADNGPAIRLLAGFGFRKSSTFSFYGKKMFLFRRFLDRAGPGP